MIDNKTDAAEFTELHDDELEHAVGGRMTTPAATPQAKPRPKGGDPCDGGE